MACFVLLPPFWDSPFCLIVNKLTTSINPFMHSVEKWPNIFLKSYSLTTARFFKYVWPFFNLCMKGLHLKFQEIQKTLKLNRTKNMHRLFKLLRDTKRHEKLLKISRIIATSTNDEKKALFLEFNRNTRL